MIRAAVLCLALSVVSPAWIESVEFQWNAYPKPLWERELVWLKNIGITHVSLPPATDVAELTDVIRIVRRLDLEADLEGPVPTALESWTKAHGGPLTGPLPGSPVRVSAMEPGAFIRTRELRAKGSAAMVWTEVEDTVGPSGYKPGAVNFAGEEKPGTVALRRSAQVTAYWNKSLASPGAAPGVTKQESAAAPRPEIRQLMADHGASVVSVVNKSAKTWTGDLRVFYPPAKHMMNITGVTVPARDALWLPVHVPLTAGPLCRNCSAFANGDHVVYATAELTAMEYENGILAMEFAAPVAGEAILQLSQEPSGPLVAGGRPSQFDWDRRSQRARLKIPAGAGPGNHVRIGLAIQPPDATAFFESARVLMIGETNSLPAEFSSDAIAQRSRIRIAPAFPAEQEPGKESPGLTYKVTVPDTVVHGDHAALAIEADGMQLSHARPQLLRPVGVKFPDAIDVHLAADAALPLFPATVSVNQKAGREITMTLRNNAPEIRSFVAEPRAEGLEFSPAGIEITVGASAARELSFRVFADRAAPGIHAGAVTISGAVRWEEPVQFAVIPQAGAVAYGTSGFWFIESAKTRASFMAGHWLEYVNKENGQNLLASGGQAFTPGTIITRGDALVFEGNKSIRLEDLAVLAVKPKK
ncbi:MAG: hypothetical protein M3N93_05345 [Acidobacteriota bacterium]|nr:hypothetical protein [Acidobacteriota bacterium]